MRDARPKRGKDGFSLKMGEVIAALAWPGVVIVALLVFSFGGSLGSVEANSLVAFGGAPVAWPNAATRACCAALQMLAEVKELNQTTAAEHLPPLRLSLGILSGPAVVGRMGPRQRFNYSVSGMPVDQTWRITGLSHHYKADAIIAAPTYEEIRDAFEVRHLGDINLEGQGDPVSLYELLSPRGEVCSQCLDRPR